MRLLTASKAHLVFPKLGEISGELGCTYWLQDHVEHNDPPGPAAAIGTAFHHVAELHVAKGQAAAETELARLQDDGEDANTVSALYLQWLRWFEGKAWELGTLRPELQLAYSPDAWSSSTRVKHAAGHDYGGLNPRQFLGATMDLAWLPETAGTDTVRQPIGVFDYKTGRTPVAANSPQMAVYAAAALRYFDQPNFYGEAGRFFPSPPVVTTVVTVHEDGVTEESHTFSADNVLQIDRILAKHLADHQSITHPIPNPGPYCTTCPARHACPATKALVAPLPAKVVQAPVPHPFSPEINGVEHAAWLVQVLPLIRGYVDRVEAALKTFADNTGGIDQGNGAVYSGQEERVEYPNANNPVAREALRQMGLGAAIRHTVTWKDLVRVGGPDKAEAARAKLKELGALKSYGKMVYRGRRPKKLKAKENIGTK